MLGHLHQFRGEIMSELLMSVEPNGDDKDILVAVKDQLPDLRRCIDSVVEHTQDYRLIVFDNASDAETADYLMGLWEAGVLWDYWQSDQNLGYIAANNQMAAHGRSPYLVLLNSDTVVKPGWDRLMLNYLAVHPEVAQVGYGGARFGADFRGEGRAYGSGVDYLEGWCFCIDRRIYDRHGLFDDRNLKFAYFEDSDYSLRLREAGHQVYGLHSGLVEHVGNRTISEVYKEMGDYLRGTFRANQDYMTRRWSTARQAAEGI